MSPFTPFEELCHCTVRIETLLPSGAAGSGTGFFYEFDRGEDGSCVPAIVTNWHVVEGAIKGRLVITVKSADGFPEYGKAFTFVLDEFEQRWLRHPDPSIDLAIMGLEPLHQLAREQGVELFICNVSEGLIPSDDDVADFIGSEKVAMVGYPNGLWDSVNNLPIVRTGSLASMYSRDWNGKGIFLIDMSVFPGSSGSPVFVFDIGTHAIRGNVVVAGHRIKFLGVTFAVQLHSADSIVDGQAGASVLMPNNLGLAVKSTLLRDFDGLIKTRAAQSEAGQLGS